MNFVFKFDPDPKFDPKNAFFNFFKFVILWMRCHQISSVAVCVELTEFLDNIFKMLIFKPNSTFLKFYKPIWLRILKGLWPYTFSRYFDFKRPKSWKNYRWNSCAMTYGNLRQNSASDQNVEENRPLFCGKNGSLSSLHFQSKARFCLKWRFIIAWLFQAYIFQDLGSLR